MEDYYKILEVNQSASPETIEKVYKILVKKYHPDLQNNSNKSQAEEKIKKINEAYDVLSDPIKRAEYDNTLIKNNISIEEYNKIVNENIELKKELNYIRTEIGNIRKKYSQNNYNENYTQNNYAQNNYTKQQYNNLNNNFNHSKNYYDTNPNNYEFQNYYNNLNNYKKNKFGIKNILKSIFSILLTGLIIYILFKIPFINNFINNLFNFDPSILILAIIVVFIYISRK